MRRQPDSLPDPSKRAGTVNDAMPFDHIVVVMMENHSFDNLLGELPRSGQPAADGLTFDSCGTATNTNHGSAATSPSTFTLANRWFCSAPCMTFPNRRFLMAGTAYGDISTDAKSLTDPPPPNGTIFDRLHAHGISWRNYFTDLPYTGIIPSILEKYFDHLPPIDSFYEDCAAGALPAVSFVDPEVGVLSFVGKSLSSLPIVGGIASELATVGGDEEAPQDMSYGEAWAHRVVEAVLHSPAWPRTLLIYTYDEHGGYYDHVPPPRAIPPDSIAPKLTPTDVPGGYDLYGPRVPAIVASHYSKPNGVTDVVHDHTSVLATIAAKWNLPALTYRDANAATVMDFLNPGQAVFVSPPAIKGPRQ
jgi:phospholipase C